MHVSSSSYEMSVSTLHIRRAALLPPQHPRQACILLLTWQACILLLIWHACVLLFIHISPPHLTSNDSIAKHLLHACILLQPLVACMYPPPTTCCMHVSSSNHLLHACILLLTTPNNLLDHLLDHCYLLPARGPGDQHACILLLIWHTRILLLI